MRPPSSREQEEAERLATDDEPRARDVVHSEGAPILDRSSRWESLRPREVSLPTFVATELPTHLDPSDWNTGFLAVHEGEPSPALLADLRELVPQAILRDLHRPVQEFFVTPEEIEGTKLVGRWREGLADIAAALAREPPPEIVPSVRAVRSEQRRRRDLMAEPWQPLLPDDAPRKAIQLYPEDDADE